jgi:hypothetical protein
VHSQYVRSKHPPDKEYCDDGPCDVNYPVASCFRFAKIEHAAMVAGPAYQALYHHHTPRRRFARRECKGCPETFCNGCHETEQGFEGRGLRAIFHPFVCDKRHGARGVVPTF